MTEQTTEETTEPEAEVVEPTEETTEGEETEESTFPLSYVQELRQESAKHRTRAQRADDLAERLHTALVAAGGRLADPSDLPFDESHLESPEALQEAVSQLLERKPHLASRRPSGDVGQGASASGDSVDLAGILRSRAG